MRVFVVVSMLLLLSSAYIQQNPFVTVAIVGTNDIHGSAFPTDLFRTDTGQTYIQGGLQYMASMINTIREQHPGNFLYLDAGDQFQGGIEASPLISSGQIMNDYFKRTQVDSSAIGNHEFDFGPDFLFPYWMNKQDGSYNLAANLKSQSGEEDFLPKQKNVWLFTLDSGIKIGVVGLATKETTSSTAAFNQGLFPKYKFQEYSSILIRQSQLLRKQGAHAVLLLSHIGNSCDADNTYDIWWESTIQESNCDMTDQMSMLLKSIPTGTVNGVIQGHRHKFSHHWIQGVPVMGTINLGNYFNVLYLKFYNKQLYESHIEGPVPVCEKVFMNLRTCEYLNKDEAAKAGPLVEWEFHGQKVEADPEVQELFETKWLPKMKDYLRPLVMNEVILKKEINAKESKLGDFITDLLLQAAPEHDFVIINEGSFRTIWTPGIIQQQHFYNMFPFDGQFVSFQMNGRQLLQTLRIIQAGKKGFYSTANLKQHINIYPDGVRELASVTFADGSTIQEGKEYRGLAPGFLLNGGDDFKDVIGKVYNPRGIRTIGETRDVLRPQLEKVVVITEEKVYNPERPRLLIDHL